MLKNNFNLFIELITNWKKTVIYISLSVILINFINVIFVILGWNTAPEWGSIIVSSSLFLVILLIITTSLKPSLSKYVECNNCSFKSLLQDLNSDELFCPDCGDRLTES